MVIAGCGGFGFAMAAAYRREERILQQLREILQFMYCELQFHMTPLPELCRKAGNNSRGSVGAVFVHLSALLEESNGRDPVDCMASVLEFSEVTPRVRSLLEKLALTLGCFDLEGQLRGLEELRTLCGSALELAGYPCGRTGKERHDEALP